MKSSQPSVYIRRIVVYSKRDRTVRYQNCPLTWLQNVTKPLRLSLKFEVVVRGDEMSGTAKAGLLPASRLTGVRVHGRRNEESQRSI